VNKCFLIGNLTRDPELRTTGSGISVCSFTVAVTRRYTGQSGEREADFIPVVVWRTTAENCAKYLRKGSQVAVTGSIQVRNYETQEGQRRTATEVIADEVQFLNRIAGREDGQTGGYERSSAAPAAPAKAAENPASDMTEIDEDLPF